MQALQPQPSEDLTLLPVNAEGGRNETTHLTPKKPKAVGIKYILSKVEKYYRNLIKMQ